MSINARDIAQRSIGCIGFSALAHTSLIAALLLAPKSVSDLGLSAAGKQNLSEGDGSVEVIAAQNQPAAPARNEAEAVAAAPVPPPQPLPKPQPQPEPRQELPPPPVKKIAPVRAEKPKAVVKAAPAAKVHTTANSDVMIEPTDKNVELENLSPVVVERPMDPSSDDAERVEAQAPAPAVQYKVQNKEDVATEETPQAEPAAAPAASEKAIEPQAASEPETASQPQKVAASAASGAGSADGEGSGTGTSGAGNNQGHESATGPVIEASLRRPLPGNQLPPYPRQDRLLKREGTSVVIGDVRPNGTVDNVRLERGSGSKEMDSAAIAAFKKWKFAPGAEATVRKSFQFSLQGPEQVSYSSLKR